MTQQVAHKPQQEHQEQYEVVDHAGHHDAKNDNMIKGPVNSQETLLNLATSMVRARCMSKSSLEAWKSTAASNPLCHYHIFQRHQRPVTELYCIVPLAFQTARTPAQNLKPGKQVVTPHLQPLSHHLLKHQKSSHPPLR